MAALKLKELRERMGLSMREAAEIAGKPGISSYAHYEDVKRFKRQHLPFELVEPLAKEAIRRGQDPSPWYSLAGIETGMRSVIFNVAEPEAAEWHGPEDDMRARAARMFTGQNSSWHPWLIRGRALNLVGYLPGDVVIMDHATNDPAAGSVVVANLYDIPSNTARTVIRLFEPPYLVSASSDPSYRKPELVDENHVLIRGTAVANVRILI